MLCKKMNKEFLILPFNTNWIVWVQCTCFSVLYSIWVLPETILIRHICLIIGSLLGLYVICKYRHLFLSKTAIPAWLLLALFVWITFHLIFLSADYDAQYAEYKSIWKRTAMGAIFAFGFGIVLADLLKRNAINNSLLWTLLYLGLLGPTLIYIAKYSLVQLAKHWGLLVPDYLLLYSSSAPFYLPKTAYICFCLPTFGVALGQLLINIQTQRVLVWGNGLYLATILAIFFVFYSENIKNGVIHSILLILLFLCFLVKNNFRKYFLSKLAVLCVILAMCSFFVENSIRLNNSWGTFVADAKIAVDTETYQQWKFNSERGYPVNELGTVVSNTNYDRLAWGTIGLALIIQNPLGYGLIERSFGRLSKVNWPESKLHQSHSGWIDLTLGLGVPGLILILSNMFILIFWLNKFALMHNITYDRFRSMIFWTLCSSLIMWSTAEVSQKIYLDELIFYIALGSGFIIANNLKSNYGILSPQI